MQSELQLAPAFKICSQDSSSDAEHQVRDLALTIAVHTRQVVWSHQPSRERQRSSVVDPLGADSGQIRTYHIYCLDTLGQCHLIQLFNLFKNSFIIMLALPSYSYMKSYFPNQKRHQMRWFVVCQTQDTSRYAIPDAMTTLISLL